MVVGIPLLVGTLLLTIRGGHDGGGYSVGQRAVRQLGDGRHRTDVAPLSSRHQSRLLLQHTDGVTLISDGLTLITHGLTLISDGLTLITVKVQ